MHMGVHVLEKQKVNFYVLLLVILDDNKNCNFQKALKYFFVKYTFFTYHVQHFFNLFKCNFKWLFYVNNLSNILV